MIRLLGDSTPVRLSKLGHLIAPRITCPLIDGVQVTCGGLAGFSLFSVKGTNGTLLVRFFFWHHPRIWILTCFFVFFPFLLPIADAYF
jgi:hypothetical protein